MSDSIIVMFSALLSEKLPKANKADMLSSFAELDPFAQA